MRVDALKRLDGCAQLSGDWCIFGQAVKQLLPECTGSLNITIGGGEMPSQIQRFRAGRGHFDKPRQQSVSIIDQSVFGIAGDDGLQRCQLGIGICNQRIRRTDKGVLRRFGASQNVIGAGKALPAWPVFRIVFQPSCQPVNHAGNHRVTIFSAHLAGSGNVSRIRAG